MRQVVNINGYETVIEIPEGQELSPVKVKGDQTNYSIEYGNGLKEVGGTVDVNVKSAADGFNDGTQRIELPLFTVLDFQVTLVKTSTALASTVSDSVSARLEGGVLVVIGSTNAGESKTIRIKWMAKGIA